MSDERRTTRGPATPRPDRGSSAVVLGALCLSTSSTFVVLAGTSATTAALFRCAYAVPVLALVVLGCRLVGRAQTVDWSSWPAWAGGVAFGVDLVLWHEAIAAAGAGVATVLGNLQVIIVALLARLLLGQRIPRRLPKALPVAAIGVVLVSGVGQVGTPGPDPVLGLLLGIAASAAYAVFILCQSRAGTGPRKARGSGALVLPTLVAAVTAGVWGALDGSIVIKPTGPEHLWLVFLALMCQVAGWLLVSHGLTTVSPALTSFVLLLQPAAALVVARVVLDERPQPLQWCGALLVLLAVWWAAGGSTAHDAARARPVVEPDESLAPAPTQGAVT